MINLSRSYLVGVLSLFAAGTIFCRAASPTITTQPQNQLVQPGSNAVFTVVASNATPVRYQWFKETNFISGATSSTLVLSNVQLADVAHYKVRVSATNNSGSVTSAPAELAVRYSYTLNLPAGYSFIANQLYNTNNNLNTVLPVAPDGSVLYKWRANFQDFGPFDTYFDFGSPDIGWYDDSLNPSSTTFSPGEGGIIHLPTNAVLTFNGAVRPPQLPLSLVANFNLVSAQNPLPATFEDIVGLPPSEGTVVDQWDPAIQDYRTHIFALGQWRNGIPLAKVGESVFISHIQLPFITQQPIGRTNVAVGSNITFSVTADGTLPIRYQWRRNGVSIPDATNSTFQISNAQLTDGGIYTVAVQSGRLAPPAGAQPPKDEDLSGAVSSVPVALKFNTANNVTFSDSFSGQTTVTNSQRTTTGTNSAATTEAGEPRHAGKVGGHSVWVTWSPLADGIVTFDTLGSAFDTLLAAYTGVSIGGPEAAGDDDSGAYLSSRISFNATANVNYRIAVDGFSGSAGDFVLSWNLEETTERLPVIVAQPQNVVATLNGGAQFTVSATGSSLAYQWLYDGQPISGANQSNYIIASVQDTNTGVYTVRVTGAGVNRFVVSREALLQIRGPAPFGLALIDDEPDALAMDKFEDVAADATNLVSLVRKHGGQGAVAHGFSGTQIFSTARAAKQPGELDHCGVRGGASYWYAYQATNNGTLHINTDGSNFDTVLAVYTGSGATIASLVPLTCDNNNGRNGKTDRVIFPATRNAIYWLAVDGVNDPAKGGLAATGSVHLNYYLILPLTVSSTFSKTNNGQVVFKVTGSPIVSTKLQTATTLSPLVWADVLTTNTGSGTFFYTLTNVVASPKRFYRAINAL